ncbi:unnamed protein product [Blepharisma stoltei]|uniref:Uncharacterized protein n=1 Tax=Blepharisma stoltei TaxID=1481888 RepID=A0AAU9JEG0_9CILI|nr:unnamed protein product [Blepharisma stoltei]
MNPTILTQSISHDNDYSKDISPTSRSLPSFSAKDYLLEESVSYPRTRKYTIEEDLFKHKEFPHPRVVRASHNVIHLNYAEHKIHAEKKDHHLIILKNRPISSSLLLDPIPNN